MDPTASGEDDATMAMARTCTDQELGMEMDDLTDNQTTTVNDPCLPVHEPQTPPKKLGARPRESLVSVGVWVQAARRLAPHAARGFLVACYAAYLCAAMITDWRRAWGLTVVSALAACIKLDVLKYVLCCARPPWLERAKYWLLAGFVAAVLSTSLVFIILAAIQSPRRLIPLVGLLAFHGVAVLFSTNRSAIKWRPVLWGLTLQLALALFVLRTSLGVMTFQFIGAAFDRLMEFSDVGAEFVFGASFTDHFVAFKILPSITFFSALVSLLYYFGVMQCLIRGCAVVMSETTGLSPCETIVAAANIFLGMTSAPLLVKPLLPHMTPSELHSMMVSGFATLAGCMITVYGALDVPTSHLVAASVMSAPAALGITKLLCPEDRVPTPLKDWEMRSAELNAVEALTAGALESIPLVSSLAVVLIAVLGLVAMADATLSWLGSLVNYPDLTFDRICSILFLPVALAMGVEWKDASQVASLLGAKTILNDFVAYTRLSVLIRTGALSEYSVLVASYALCGFANLGSVGMMIAMFAMLVPSRTAEVSQLAIRALLGGTLACLCTACVAGLLYDAGPVT